MYRVHEFALLAGVTVKALHHYDRLGLLKPHRAESGYRLYAEQDLERLEQIVALKFLGLPLKQIRTLLDRDTFQLPEALGAQRAVLEEKRRLLDRAIEAISKAEKIVQSGEPAGSAVLKEIIEAIEMQNEPNDATDFMKNYYREDVWAGFKDRHRAWPGSEWRRLFADIQTALADDPGGPQAQNLAQRWRTLRATDAAGDPKVHLGLLKAWGDRQYWPEAVQRQFSDFDFAEISKFIAAAFAAYRKKHYGEIVWVKDLDAFTLEEKERLPLASLDLYFKIAGTLDQDPSADAAQSLAARWMEIMESRTGSFEAQPGWYEQHIKWIDSWPPAIHQKARSFNSAAAMEFMLKAISQPMHP